MKACGVKKEKGVMSSSRTVVLCIFLLFLYTSAYADIDVFFPEKESRVVLGQKLAFQLHGQAKREFLFFDVYDVGNYVSENWQIAGKSVGSLSRSVIELGEPKMLVLKYHRDLGLKKVKKVLLEGFQKNTTDEEWELIQSELNSFLSRIDKDIKKGDQLELIWSEEDHLVISFQRRLFGERKSLLFLRTLWSIWFGDNAVVDRASLFRR